MISFESAKQKILNNTPLVGTKYVPLTQCDGYVLAEEIKTKEAVPAFDSSAVDGYAVRYQDVVDTTANNPVGLSLTGMIRAGDAGNVNIKKNSAVKIFTGAPVPRLASAIVMKEVTEEENGKVFIKKKAIKGQNIRKKGEEFRIGETIFSPGKIISPPVVAMLASLGVVKVKVYKKPRITLIITGDEVRPPSAKIKKGQIRDSNSFALVSSLHSIGIDAIDIKHIGDSRSATQKAFTTALKRSDVIISVGGVSVGDYDLVKDVLREIGVNEIFWRVAMKPGKPNYFGVKNNKLVFGLPGNPVSAMISYYVLIRPCILKMMGASIINPFVMQARLTEAIKKKPDRIEFVRGIVEKNNAGTLQVTPVRGQDSHMIGGMAEANCLIYFPKGLTVLNSSSLVDVEMLEW